VTTFDRTPNFDQLDMKAAFCYAKTSNYTSLFQSQRANTRTVLFKDLETILQRQEKDNIIIEDANTTLAIDKAF
jgi:hypothetical protein